MITDKYTRLATAQDFSAAQTTFGQTSLTDDWFDLLTQRSLGDGQELFMVFTCTTAVASSTATATVEFRIVATPRTTLAFTVPDSDINTTTDFITKVAHGLTNGSVVTVVSTTGALPTSTPQIATGTHYFVKNATADTFQLSTTPNGTVINFTVAGSGTHSFLTHTVCLGSSGPIPKNCLTAGAIVKVAFNPMPTVPFPRQTDRYVFGGVLPSAGLSAAAFTVDVVPGIDTAQRMSYAQVGTQIT